MAGAIEELDLGIELDGIDVDSTPPCPVSTQRNPHKCGRPSVARVEMTFMCGSVVRGFICDYHLMDLQAGFFVCDKHETPQEVKSWRII